MEERKEKKLITKYAAASVGNSIAIESREKNYRDMRRFNFMYMAGGLGDGLHAFAVDAVMANSGHTKLFELVGLVARLLLCTLVTVAGYYVAYHHTTRYQDAKEWVKSRYNVFRIEK